MTSNYVLNFALRMRNSEKGRPEGPLSDSLDFSAFLQAKSTTEKTPNCF